MFHMPLTPVFYDRSQVNFSHATATEHLYQSYAVTLLVMLSRDCQMKQSLNP